jgi:preprotein translocase subunit SecF
MTMSEHKFRYLLPPGSDFQFVAKFRTWFTISVILLAVSIGSLFVNKAVRGQYMNWNTDFKGGTEITFSFKDKAGAFTTVQPQDVRKALRDGGEDGFDVSEMSFTADADTGTTAQGSIVRTPRFAAAEPAQQQKAQTAFEEPSSRTASCSSSTGPATCSTCAARSSSANEEAAPAFVTAGLELKPWAEKDTRQFAHADEGTKEYNAAFTVWGIDRQLERVLEKGLPNIDVTPMQSYGVGAKAGDKLRDDAASSRSSSRCFLIMLYLAVRFDIRFAPGGVPSPPSTTR